MIIRYATEQDEQTIRQMWSAAFDDTEAYLQWYFANIYQPQRTLCLQMEDGELAASLQLHPYQMQLGSQLIDVAYLVGVNTREQYRHRGFGHVLLQRAIDDLRADGCQFALLNTDIPEFYQPLGFVNCYNLRRCVIPVASAAFALACRQAANLSADIAAYDAIYRQMCKQFDGFISRSADDWRNFVQDHLTDAQSGVLLADDFYLLWSISGQQLQVGELGYADEAAMQKGLAAASNLAAEHACRQVVWAMPQASPLPIQPNEELLPHVMARSLALDSAADALEVSRKTKLQLSAPRADLWVNEII